MKDITKYQGVFPAFYACYDAEGMIIIDHGNGYQTYYGHNSSLVAAKGEKVHKGQLIARMGSTGRSTGNHCHFGIKLNGTFVNPLNYL